jgi:WD40 repeat protein/transcriptional regulator with XRE-family HTH domain
MGQDLGRAPAGAPLGDRDELASVATRADLGVLLTELRVASNRSLRELATAVGSSPSTLSGWLRAKSLPFPSQYGVFADLLAELGVADADPWIDAVTRVRNATSASHTNDRPAPYRGLESYGVSDADRFFGRTQLVERAWRRLNALRDDPSRPQIVAVVGASGSGKSSILHAGLRPRIAEAGRPSVALTPGAHPIAALVAALTDHLGETSEGTATASATDPRILRTRLAPLEPGRGPVLVVDQLEELFTLCDDADERDRFLATLVDLATHEPTGPPAIPVLFGLRIDFYGQLVASGHLRRTLQDHQVLVGPMDPDQLTSAIVEPPRTVGWSVDDDLVTVLLRDFVPVRSIGERNDAGALPLLSHALLETWQHASQGRLTVADYHATGGIDGAIERSAERIVGELEPRELDLVRQMFLRLVNVDQTAVVTRRAASFDELAGLAASIDDRQARPASSTSAALDELVGRFIDARLLTAYASSVQITHEALLGAWPRLRRWVEEARESLAVHRMLAEATRLWDDSDRDPTTLASGARLVAMEAWAADGAPPLTLTAAEQQFLDASVARRTAVERAERRSTTRLRTLLAVTTVLTLIAASLAVVANASRQDAVAARDDALSRQVALQADRLRDTDPSLAAQLAVVAYDIAPTSDARSVLFDAVAFPRSVRSLGGAGSPALAVSQAGALVAVGDGVEGSVRLLRVDASELAPSGTVPLEGDEVESYAAAFSPDGTVLAVGSTDATITLWDVSDPAAPQELADPLRGPEGPIQAIAIAPDGSELAAVGLGDGAFRWELSDPRSPEPLPLIPNEHITWSVAYAPDGRHLAVGDDVGGVTIWELSDTSAPVITLQAEDRSMFGVSFAPDGGTVAAGSRAGRLHVWDISELASPVELELEEAVFDSWVNATAFSDDGTLLVAGSSDAGLRVWETATWEPRQTLPHPAALTGAAFVDDAATIVTTSTDGTAWRWDLDRTAPLRLAGRVWDVAFTDDGTRMSAFSGADTGVWTMGTADHVVAEVARVASPEDGPPFSGGGGMSADGRWLGHGTLTGEVLLYDLTDTTAADGPVPTHVLEGASDLVESVSFSADGRVLAAGGADDAVRIFALDGSDAPRLTSVLDEPTQLVLDTAWDSTSRLLAVPSADSRTYLYDATDPAAPELVSTLDGFDSEAYAAAFHPDRPVVAVAGSDAVVHLWDLAEPWEPVRIGDAIAGPVGRIFSLSFAPAGDALAAAVADGTTWVWDTTDLDRPTRRATLGTGDSPMYTVGFSPSGGVLVASGADSLIRRWVTDEALAVERICASVGDAITRAEWDRYLPERAYAPPCGEPSR